MKYKNYKMKEIASFSQGKQVEVNEQYAEKSENKERFIRIVDYTNENEPIRYVKNFGERYYAKKNDLVMIRYGSQTAGKVVMGKEGIIANNMFKINLNNEIILNKYMYYYLSQKEVYKYIRNSQSSSTMPALNFGILNDFEIKIPNIEEQKRTVKILSLIDKKIDENNHTNNNLQEIIRSLYIEKFSNKRYNGKIEDILKLKKDNIKVKDIDDTLNYYPIDTLPMNYLVLKEGKSIKEANSSLQKFLKYDILLGSMRVYFHRVCLASNDGITRNTTFVMMPIQDIHLYYCLLTLDKNDFIDYASKTSKGSTMPYAVWEAIAKYEVYIPTKYELEDFNRAVSVSLEKMMSNECENENLIKLRDTLLPKLMNGEIDLENIEI